MRCEHQVNYNWGYGNNKISINVKKKKTVRLEGINWCFLNSQYEFTQADNLYKSDTWEVF